ncbi:MAG: hypothetical protein PHI18_00220 [bacterium]|nr:hypothetical protein [bacterium]
MERAFGTELWILGGVLVLLWGVSVSLVKLWIRGLTSDVKELLDNSRTQGGQIAALEERTQGHTRDITELKARLETVHGRVTQLATQRGRG